MGDKRDVFKAKKKQQQHHDRQSGSRRPAVATTTTAAPAAEATETDARADNTPSMPNTGRREKSRNRR